MKARKKNLPGVIYKMKNGEKMEAKRVPDHVENVYINCKKSLQQLNCHHCVIAARDLLF